MEKLIYHLQDMDDVPMIVMKKRVVGLDNGKNISGYHPCTTSDAIQA